MKASTVIRRLAKVVKCSVTDTLFIVDKVAKVGLKKALYSYKFRLDRRFAYRDLNSKMPLIERRVQTILNEYNKEQKNEEDRPVVRNIFVFWWDGFDNAPLVVKRCFESVKKYNRDYEVIEITKDTYKNYTNINKKIINDYEEGKISVQTFSDILRFNLLANNGGVWIDATMLFLKKYDICDELEERDFNTIYFPFSKQFFEYKGYSCSWTGFFIASRKNGVLVRTIDHIFEEYYLKYGTYSIYFFIDAVFMICKIHGIDDNVLDKTRWTVEDIFTLSKVINLDYDSDKIINIKAIPQKLSWFIKDSKNSKSYYRKLIIDGEI